MNKPKINIHGIISVSLFLVSIGIGVVSIAMYSLALSLISLLIIISAFVCVSVVYCSKCNCREHCNHWMFGKISVLLSKKKKEPYKPVDLIAGTIIPLLVAILLPQFWLLKSPALFVIYWALMAIAGAEVYFFVCNKCLNNKCSMCRNKTMIV